MRRRGISFLVILCMVMSLAACPYISFGSNAVSWKAAMTKTEKYMAEMLEDPVYGCEWTVTALARDGGAVEAGTYTAYYQDVVKEVKDCKGILDSRKALPYTKVIMALTAIDKNPKNVSGYNLLNGLADFDKVLKTGTNGPIWALLALDSGKYTIPKAAAGAVQTTRTKLVNEILNRELEGGGFTVGMSSDGPETDITAMAIQALAPYRDRADVKAVVDRALSILSKKQRDDGTYMDYGTKSSESISQVILALTALDINPEKDSRFIKKGNSLIDAQMKFYVTGGGFRHVLKTTAGYDAPINGMATEQGYMALSAYKRLLAGENYVYDMTDGMPVSRPVKVTLRGLSGGLCQMTLKWNEVKGADGYQIRYSSKKDFSTCKDISVASASTISKTIKKLSTNKTYYFKVRAYKLEDDGTKVWGAFSNYKYGIPKGKIALKSLSSGLKQATVKWAKVSGADGYQIRYSTKKNFSTYGYVFVKSAEADSKTITGLSRDKTYYYKVRAYKLGDRGQKVYGTFSSWKYGTPNGKISGITVATPAKKQLKVSWDKEAGAKGYQVRYASNKSFQNSKAIFVSSKNTAQTIKKLTSGKTYYVKVRAYTKNSKGTKIYGAYSAVKSVKVR